MPAVRLRCPVTGVPEPSVDAPRPSFGGDRGWDIGPQRPPVWRPHHRVLVLQRARACTGPLVSTSAVTTAVSASKTSGPLRHLGHDLGLDPQLLHVDRCSDQLVKLGRSALRCLGRVPRLSISQDPLDHDGSPAGELGPRLTRRPPIGWPTRFDGQRHRPEHDVDDLDGDDDGAPVAGELRRARGEDRRRRSAVSGKCWRRHSRRRCPVRPRGGHSRHRPGRSRSRGGRRHR